MTVKALIFDVFGTCVDWRSSVAREVEKVFPRVDAIEFAMAWRAEYDPAMAKIRSGNRPYTDLDVLHFENLQRVCEDFNVSKDDAALWDLNKAWEKLDPWDDVLPGLNALHPNYILAPCSNGSIALMSNLKRYAKLPWDCILGAELANDYKPSAKVYKAAVDALRLMPHEVMMVAAHNTDLDGARKMGLKTAFVPRVAEYGPNQSKDLAADSDWTVIAEDFVELAKSLNSSFV